MNHLEALTDDCAYCGDYWERPNSFDERVSVWKKHLDECFSYELWKKSRPSLMAFKEYLFNRSLQAASAVQDEG